MFKVSQLSNLVFFSVSVSRQPEPVKKDSEFTLTSFYFYEVKGVKMFLIHKRIKVLAHAESLHGLTVGLLSLDLLLRISKAVTEGVGLTLFVSVHTFCPCGH